MITTALAPELAYRGDGSGVPAALRVPPERGPLVRGWRLRKHWRYVGVWGPDLALCAAQVKVGPLTHEFWAVWLRSEGQLLQRARMRGGRVWFGHDRLAVSDGVVDVDLVLPATPQTAVEVVTPSGAAWTWTRKQLTRARGTVRIGNRTIDVDAPALLEDNGGYHPRNTHWWWAAGAGTLVDGRPVAWNAVVGLNDTPPLLENTIWVHGAPQPTGPVAISDDLATTTFDDGHQLRFTTEADRSSVTDLGVLRSHYRAPFGRFAGTLPGGLQLRDGYGVMEDHRARW